MDRLLRGTLAVIPPVYLIAIALRLCWAVLIPVIPLSDSHAYDTFAVNIWQFGTYGWQPDIPDSYWPVGTSAVYALSYAIFGHTYWPIVTLNIGLSIGIIYFSKRLCRQLFSDHRIATLTTFILALWPTGIVYVTVLASELLFTFFTLAGFYFFLNSSRALSYSALVAGLCFAAAYYMRPLITVSILIIAVSSIIYLKQKPFPVLLKTVCCFIVLALMVSPWAYRNYQLYNDFVPMSTNGGAVFWMGNSPGTNGGYASLPEDVTSRVESKYEASKILKRRALEYIQQEPVTFIQRSIYKLFRFHSYETIGISWNREGIKQRFGEGAIFPLKLVTQLYWLTLVLSGVIGLGLYLFRGGLTTTLFHPYLLSWASNAGIHALVVSQDRYHLPSVPFIAAFSAIFILAVYDRIEHPAFSLRKLFGLKATVNG